MTTKGDKYGPASSTQQTELDAICQPILTDGEQPIVVDVRQVSPPGSKELFFHFHDAVEIVIFGSSTLEGQVFLAEQQQDLQPGTIVFVPSMMTHGYQFQQGGQDRLLIQYEADWIDAGLTAGTSEAMVIKPDTSTMRRIEFLGLWLLETAEQELMSGLTKSILRLMIDAIKQAAESQESLIVSAQPDTNSNRFYPLMSFIQKNPATNLSLKDAAEICHLSADHFSRIFKDNMGMSWKDYQLSRKFRLAVRRLSESNAQVAKIGYDLGFANPSHFVASFRERYSVTPNQFRQMAQISEPSQPQPQTRRTALYSESPIDWRNL